jgi:hypothetical protein
MSPIALRGGCAYSRLGAIQAVSAVQRSQASGAVRLAGDAPSIGAELPPVGAPRPSSPGRDRHAGYVILLHAAEVLKIWKSTSTIPSPYNP